MRQVSSRAGRNRHKYIGDCQREADEQSNSVNPVILTWETAVIKRYHLKGIEHVEIYRSGVLTWSSNPMQYNMNTKDLNPPKDENA